jgi:RNA polymerase sigma-70 factor (ECF subfamily)
VRPRRRISGVTGITFAQAAERHLDDVYGYLVWFTGDRFASEDLAGETFERALRLWHRFDPGRGSARTWLCQVARTVALDHLRSERRRTRREQLASAPERYEERLVEGLSPELESALRSLTAGEREVIALRVVLDLDAQTAARVLGISPTNCTTRLARALRKLEEALDVAA